MQVHVCNCERVKLLSVPATLVVQVLKGGKPHQGVPSRPRLVSGNFFASKRTASPKSGGDIGKKRANMLHIMLCFVLSGVELMQVAMKVLVDSGFSAVTEHRL